MIGKTAIWMLSFLIVGALTVIAGDQETEATTSETKDAGEKVSLSGTLVCMGCSLKPAGAHSACKEFGCSYVLKTAEGKYISFLNNKYSQPLAGGKGMQNKEVTINGAHFANANVLDVESFQVGDGKLMTWCDHCKTMDACAAK
jgi:hypothetical protein